MVRKLTLKTAWKHTAWNHHRCITQMCSRKGFFKCRSKYFADVQACFSDIPHTSWAVLLVALPPNASWVTLLQQLHLWEIIHIFWLLFLIYKVHVVFFFFFWHGGHCLWSCGPHVVYLLLVTDGAQKTEHMRSKNAVKIRKQCALEKPATPRTTVSVHFHNALVLKTEISLFQLGEVGGERALLIFCSRFPLPCSWSRILLNISSGGGKHSYINMSNLFLAVRS